MERRRIPIFILQALVAIAFLHGTTASLATGLEGAWSLDGYEVSGVPQQDVTGLLVMVDGRFGLIYTMTSDDDDDALSGRAHFGRYAVDGDRIVFDVRWWPEQVNGAARAVPPASEGAALSVGDGTLEFRFGSGSLQRWTRLDGEDAIGAGVWHPVEGGTDGLLLVAAGRFAFVSAMQAGADATALRAYGGTVEPREGAAGLNARWLVQFVGGEGRVANHGPAMRLELESAGRASLHGPGGAALELRK